MEPGTVTKNDQISGGRAGGREGGRAGALVKWLREETHNQKVVSSNPGAGYWTDIIFTLIFVEKFVMFV